VQIRDLNPQCAEPAALDRNGDHPSSANAALTRARFGLCPSCEKICFTYRRSSAQPRGRGRRSARNRATRAELSRFINSVCAFVPVRSLKFRIAYSASFACSTALVYRDTSDTDLWPVIAMISRSLPSRTYRTPSCFAASRTSTERPL
jgi:hypothetical protein